MYIDEKYNKILDLIYSIIQILNKDKFSRVNEKLLINNIDFLNSNYELIVLLLKVSLRIEKNSKLLSFIRYIVVEKKELILIKDIDNNLLLFKYLQSVGYFISYKKDILNYNQNNYFKFINNKDKEYKKIFVCLIHLKSYTHDKDNRYFLIDKELYNEYLTTINLSAIKKDIHNNYIYYDKSFLYGRYGKIKTKKSTFKQINRSKLVEYLNDYYKLVYVTNNTYKSMNIINNDYIDYLNIDLFSLIRDYFDYYKGSNIYEYLKKYNIEVIDDLKRPIRSNNNLNEPILKVFVSNDLSKVGFCPINRIELKEVRTDLNDLNNKLILSRNDCLKVVNKWSDKYDKKTLKILNNRLQIYKFFKNL